MESNGHYPGRQKLIELQLKIDSIVTELQDIRQQLGWGGDTPESRNESMNERNVAHICEEFIRTNIPGLDEAFTYYEKQLEAEGYVDTNEKSETSEIADYLGDLDYNTDVHTVGQLEDALNKHKDALIQVGRKIADTGSNGNLDAQKNIMENGSWFLLIKLLAILKEEKSSQG